MGTRANFGTQGILKAVFNIVDIIAHKLLDMGVWEQPEIDKLLVETLDGSKYEWCWFSRANFSANATLSISTTVCRAGAAKSEVRLYTYISKPTDTFMMPVLCSNVISGGSHAGNCLACPEFLIVPTGAGNVAEDMIADTEVNHTLKFGHQQDVRRDACNVGNETGFAPIVQLSNQMLDFLTDSFEQDQVSSHVENEASSHERRVSFAHPYFQECSIQLCAETCCGEKRFTSLESSVFWFSSRT